MASAECTRLKGSSQGGFCHGLKKARIRPFIIGVAGGTASGKSSVCAKIVEAIKNDPSTKSSSIVCLSLDNLYKDISSEDSEQAFHGSYNFDHPDALDLELVINVMRDIRERTTTKIPKYDFKLNARTPDVFENIDPSDVVLVEGILAFYWPELRDKYDMKLFVDTDADTRLARRVKRDISERGRTLDTILHQYITSVKPAFEEFCLPTKKFADVIIPRGADNTVAIDLIVQSIKDVLASDSSLSRDEPEQQTGRPPPPPLVKRNSDLKTSRLH